MLGETSTSFPAVSDGVFTMMNTEESKNKTVTRRHDRFIRKNAGLDWEIWDGKSVLHDDLGVCNWKEFRAFGMQGGQPPGQMCLYPRGEDQYVSGAIEGNGRWSNCDDLTAQLSDMKHAVYVDIGANIGSCVMQVLYTTAAHVIAFEPHPKNLFRLTSTLMNLTEAFKSRVTLFPVALGDATGSVTLMTNPTNAGNTQVQRSAGDVGVDGANVVTHNITVERVDDLLSHELRIDVIK
jgi:FkbM family methyltransferase